MCGNVGNSCPLGRGVCGINCQPIHSGPVFTYHPFFHYAIFCFLLPSFLFLFSSVLLPCKPVIVRWWDYNSLPNGNVTSAINLVIIDPSVFMYPLSSTLCFVLILIHLFIYSIPLTFLFPNSLKATVYSYFRTYPHFHSGQFKPLGQ